MTKDFGYDATDKPIGNNELGLIEKELKQFISITLRMKKYEQVNCKRTIHTRTHIYNTRITNNIRQ